MVCRARVRGRSAGDRAAVAVRRADDAGFAPWVDPARVRRVLDIGTGPAASPSRARVPLPESARRCGRRLAAGARGRAPSTSRGTTSRIACSCIEGDVFEPVARPPLRRDRLQSALRERRRDGRVAAGISLTSRTSRCAPAPTVSMSCGASSPARSVTSSRTARCSSKSATARTRLRGRVSRSALHVARVRAWRRWRIPADARRARGASSRPFQRRSDACQATRSATCSR